MATKPRPVILEEYESVDRRGGIETKNKGGGEAGVKKQRKGEDKKD